MLLRNPFARKPTAPPEGPAEMSQPAASLPEWEDAEEESGAPAPLLGDHGHAPVLTEATRRSAPPKVASAKAHPVQHGFWKQPAHRKLLEDHYPAQGAPWIVAELLRTEGVTVTAAAVRQAAAKLGVKTERSSGELAAAARAAKKTEPAVVAPLAEPLEPAKLCKPPRGVAQKSRVTAPPAEPEVTAADLIRRSDKRGEWGFQDDADCRVSLGKLLDRKCDETGKPRAVVALHLMGTLLREVTG